MKRIIGNVTPRMAFFTLLMLLLVAPAIADTATLYDGTVTLTPDATFDKVAYNSGVTYTIGETTPLGALQATGLTYDVTDKNYATSGALLLDNVDSYIRKTPGYWYAYVNDAYKDGYNNAAGGLNLIALADGDRVEFYYAAGISDPTDLAAVQAAATAAVKTVASIGSGPAVDVLFDGTVILTPDATFDMVAYNSDVTYTVSQTTPLGALNGASTSAGFTYDVTDKKFTTSGILMLDNIGEYLYSKTAGTTWICQVNGVTLDDYSYPATDGLNLKQLSDGDQVNFYYGIKPVTPETATAVVEITVDIASTEAPDWTLALKGARETTVSQTFFEEGLACSSSGHQVFWTDDDGNIWGGVPLWLLVAMVDDDPDVGSAHFNFNDDLAAQGYSVKVASGDGWDTTLASADIARSDGYIVANTLNGEPLAFLLDSGKRSWPLQLKGEAVFGGQQVGNITSLELTGLPEPVEGWTLTLIGDVTDVMTESYFEEAVACHHSVKWTDSDGNEWEGVSLWDLAGAVDDIETTSHYTFNDTRAALGYTIRVTAGDGFSATFASADAAHNNGYFLAHMKNGAPLTGDDAPLKLVGPSTTSNKQRVGNVVSISLEGLPTFPQGDWELKLVGKISDTIPQSEFEYWASCHSATYADADGNVYTGIPLWRLMGWVDDTIPHGSNGFNTAAATAGYTVIVKAGDTYSKEFSSKDIGKSNNYIVANTMNGAPLPAEGEHAPYPLRLVGANATGGKSVGNIVEIELTDFQTAVEPPQLHIVKYDTDGTTVLDEVTIDYTYMEENFEVIGDGVTHYIYQGLTLDPADLWDPTETKGMNPPKVDNAIKGTKVKDLVDLVGGMGTGTDIVFIASDGYETKLGYSNVYTNPYVQSHQGDLVLAWYADGEYVPEYDAGMRLFFTPDDHVFGQWNMHEALDEKYWHYNWQGGVQYPSAAGTSNQNVIEIKVYSSPETDWQIELDGTQVGGISTTISKTYFEQALACTFGSEHKQTYTDAKGRVWSGMPLWFLAGFVDDDDQHSDTAFNEALAESGYRIIVTGTDDYSTEIDSRLFIRTTNYLVANTLGGVNIDESDENWPLRLTGANVSGSAVVKGVAKIQLVPYETPEPVLTLTKSASKSEVLSGDTVTFTYILKNDGTGALTGIVLTDDQLGVISGPASGDENANGELDAGESWTYTADAIITVTVTNTATAEGSNAAGETITATSNAVTVTVGGSTPAPEFPVVWAPLAILGALAVVVRAVRRE